MVSYVRYTTKIAKENRTLGKSVGFSEYTQNQATRQPACPPVPVRTGMTCRAGTTLSGWLYTVLCFRYISISVTIFFARLIVFKYKSESNIDWYLLPLTIISNRLSVITLLRLMFSTGLGSSLYNSD